MPPTLHVEADVSVGSACLAYNLQASLQHVQSELLALQSALQHVLPTPLFLTPASTCHISIQSLVHVYAELPDKPAAWARIQPEVIAALRHVAAQQPAFELQFMRVSVKPRAIILTAHDPTGAVHALRSRFSDLLARAQIPAPRYDLVHTTLARFRVDDELAMEHVKQLEALPVTLRVSIASLQVVRELVFPSLQTEEVDSVQLV